MSSITEALERRSRQKEQINEHNYDDEINEQRLSNTPI